MNIFKNTFFKKKKLKKKFAKSGLLTELTPVFDIPEVIRESKIKPTKCKGCFSIYQAKHKHIKNSCSFIQKRITFCPVCNTENSVEFENDDDIPEIPKERAEE